VCGTYGRNNEKKRRGALVGYNLLAYLANKNKFFTHANVCSEARKQREREMAKILKKTVILKTYSKKR